jgi:hypothetical protein
MCNEDSINTVDALVMYWHNTEPDELLGKVYTDCAPRYFEEKMSIWKHGLTYFWGQLDREHRHKLMMAAWEKYGLVVQRRSTYGYS